MVHAHGRALLLLGTQPPHSSHGVEPRGRRSPPHLLGVTTAWACGLPPASTPDWRLCRCLRRICGLHRCPSSRYCSARRGRALLLAVGVRHGCLGTLLLRAEGRGRRRCLPPPLGKRAAELSAEFDRLSSLPLLYKSPLPATRGVARQRASRRRRRLASRHLHALILLPVISGACWLLPLRLLCVAHRAAGRSGAAGGVSPVVS